MREFTKVIAPELVAGLRPDDRLQRNQQFLYEAFNVLARKEGLSGFESITDPFNGTLTVDFPFPQIYVGKEEILLLGKTQISEVDELSTPWDYTAIPIEDYEDIPEGGVWHVADFNGSWYLFNGSCIIGKIDGEVFVNDQIDVSTGTNFRGRCIVGGLDASEVWGDHWDNIFEFWREKNSFLPQRVLDSPDQRYVMWSSIGGGDFPLWLFKPEILSVGSFDKDDGYGRRVPDSFIIDRLRMNQLGFMPMPFRGKVLSVKELGNGVMVYGEDGIAYMPHSSGGEGIAPTFGMIRPLPVGIAGRGAVGGSNSQHIFIDIGGNLWSVGVGEAGVDYRRLGYKEYLLDLIEDDVVISFDSHRSEFYISGKEASYVLSSGLTQINQHPTSVDYIAGGLVGLYKETLDGGTIDNRVRVVTNPFDMNMRGVKTIVGLNVAEEAKSGVEVALDFRYKTSESFQRSHFVPLNNEGNAMIRVHGLEFRVVVKCSDFEDFSLDYIHVNWQPDDKRNTRGLGISPSAQGAEVG